MACPNSTTKDRPTIFTSWYARHHVSSITHVCQIMEVLGPSLWDLWNQNCQRLSEQHVACVAVEAITILQHLHAKGYAQ